MGLPSPSNQALLKDASGHKHSPIGFGYLRIPTSTPLGYIMVGCWYAPYLPAMIVSPSRICRDHNFRGFASVGLLDSNEAWIRLSARSVPTTMSLSAPIFVKGYFKVTPLIRPTAAQHAIPVCKLVLCVHQVTASDPDQAIDPASLVLPLSAPIITPAEPAAGPTAPPWSPLPCTCCATYGPCTSPAVEP
jgi:hypothetical protein